MIRNFVRRRTASRASRNEFPEVEELIEFGEKSDYKAGELLKFVNVVKGWKPRYFVLHYGMLTYYLESKKSSVHEHDANPSPIKQKQVAVAQGEGLLRQTSKGEYVIDHVTASGVVSSPVLRYRGSINMQFAVVTADDSDETRFAVDVGTQIFNLRAGSAAERDAWVAALNASKKYHEGIVTRAELRTRASRSLQQVDASKIQPVSLEKIPTGLSVDLAKINITEDDGLREAIKNRNALMAELERIMQVMAKGNPVSDRDQYLKLLEQAFAPELAALGSSGTIRTNDANVVRGIRELVEFSMNVLNTEQQLWSMQAKSSNNARSVQYEKRRTMKAKSEDVDDESDDEFFDPILLEDSLLSDEPVPSSEVASKEVSIKRIATLDLGLQGFRAFIPKPAGDLPKMSVWSFLKDAVGKDLSKIAVPVIFNEPLSFLQRMGEYLEYSNLLDQALETKDPRERLLLVTAFGVSYFSSNLDRFGKPFNPLLGETFELVSKERKMRMMAEQVSHHPPVSSIYAEGHDGEWEYRCTIEVKNKFWGKSLEIFPTGWNHIILKRFNEHYTFHQPTLAIHNICFGTLWTDTYGDVVVTEHSSGLQAHVNLLKTGWMTDKKLYASLVGEVRDAKGMPVGARIGGHWNSSIRVEIDGRKKVIWEVYERPPRNVSAGFNMTSWAIGMNTPVAKGTEKQYAPTDSRFRPDQRLLEQYLTDEATAEKLRLEEKQRRKRKLNEEQGIKHTPLWFEKKFVDVIGEEDYVFTGEYWTCKKNQDWKKCPDLFG